MALPRSKDISEVLQVSKYLPYDKLFDSLVKTPKASPTESGTISLLVQRPNLNERVIVQQAEFTIDGGMEGSGWEERPERGKIDQICVMSTAAITAIADSADRDAWAAAGDQIFMDFDLSKSNMTTGDRIVIGDVHTGVVLEVTAKPHNGCPKFSKRYGPDALKAVNCPQGKELRLRGIYFQVIRNGLIKEGDSIAKVDPTFGDIQ